MNITPVVAHEKVGVVGEFDGQQVVGMFGHDLLPFNGGTLHFAGMRRKKNISLS
jgi:hypothetical protein